MSHEHKGLEEKAKQARVVAEHIELLFIQYLAAPTAENLVLQEQIQHYAKQYHDLTGTWYVREHQRKE